MSHEHAPDTVDLTSVCMNKIDRHIIELVADGLADKEIARLVYLSPQTVRNRISRILTVSGARNRTHLAVSFIRFSGTGGGSGFSRVIESRRSVR